MKEKKIKILFIIYSLARGGAERVFSIIANNLDTEKFEIVFLTINSSFNNKYILRKEIRQIELNEIKTIISIRKIYKSIVEQQPDLVFSTIGQVSIVVGMIKFFLQLTNRKNEKIPKFLMRETSIPSINNLNSNYPSWLLNLLIKIIYPIFDRIIVQGENMKEDLISNFNINPKLLKVIHNPVELFKPQIFDRQQGDIKTIVTVGNLTKIKGYDRLLSVIARLKTRVNFNYYIVGGGEEEKHLKMKAIVLNIQDVCKFTGVSNSVKDFLCTADLFLQGSYYEGFPNVLLEAGQCGLPVVAFDVKGGTNEIIKNGFNGFLVQDNDIESYVESVILALETKFNKQNITNFIEDKFSKKKIIKEYENLFLELLDIKYADTNRI